VVPPSGAFQATGTLAGMDRGRVQRIVAKLRESEPTFDWVGVYWVDGRDLVLGPFEGNPTEHVRIRIPEGVCGSVAASGQTEVVPDVRTRPGHIACDIDTRSEVVAPIIRDGMVLGVLDIDSNTATAFDERDVLAIEAAAEEIAAS
jgi:L-methionine (R)-S-oxide reductase